MAQVETINTLRDIFSKTQNHNVATSDLEDFHRFILSQPEGEKNLQILARKTSGRVRPMTGGDTEEVYTKKVAGYVDVMNIAVYQMLELRANVDGPNKLDRSFTAHLGGISIGWLTHSYHGELFFNDVNELMGDYTVEVSQNDILEISFMRDGKIVMFYRSEVTTGTTIGWAEGEGSWK